MEKHIAVGALALLLGCGGESLGNPGSDAPVDNGPDGAGGLAHEAGTGDGGAPERDASPGIDSNLGPAADAEAPDGSEPVVGESFACLPAGEEKLVMKIKRGAALAADVNTPAGLSCSSRFHLPEGGSQAMLDLGWSTTDGALFVSVRTPGAAVGRTGVFEGATVLISKTPDAWTGAVGKCSLTLTENRKLREENVTAMLVRELHRVAGSVACAAWAPEMPTDQLQTFEFVTGAILLRAR